MRTVLFWIAIGASVAAAAPNAPNQAAKPKRDQATAAQTIKAAAAGYRKWGRVDDRPNLAPALCRQPLPADHGATPQLRASDTDAGSPHGRKLYYLWSSSKHGYINAPDKVPIGFTIVKESFAAAPDKRSTSAADDRVVVDGKPMTIGKPSGLFVMTKVADTAIEGSDDGWLYGTVAPDGSVTSAGALKPCIECHQTRKGRLFGLAR